MTTIVFDGKTLAADTGMYSNDTYSGEISKVREIELNGKKCLIAMCGEFADFEPFISKAVKPRHLWRGYKAALACEPVLRNTAVYISSVITQSRQL